MSRRRASSLIGQRTRRARSPAPAGPTAGRCPRRRARRTGDRRDRVVGVEERRASWVDRCRHCTKASVLGIPTARSRSPSPPPRLGPGPGSPVAVLVASLPSRLRCRRDRRRSCGRSGLCVPLRGRAPRTGRIALAASPCSPLPSRAALAAARTAIAVLDRPCRRREVRALFVARLVRRRIARTSAGWACVTLGRSSRSPIAQRLLVMK